MDIIELSDGSVIELSNTLVLGGENIVTIGLTLAQAILDGYVDDTGGGSGTGASNSVAQIFNRVSGDDATRKYTALNGDHAVGLAAYVSNAGASPRTVTIGIWRESDGQLLAGSGHDFVIAPSAGVLGAESFTYPSPIPLVAGEVYRMVNVGVTASNVNIGDASSVTLITSQQDASDTSAVLNDPVVPEGANLNRDFIMSAAVVNITKGLTRSLIGSLTTPMVTPMVTNMVN